MAVNTARNNLRLYVLSGVLVFWCCAICLRLVQLQIFQYGQFERKKDHEQQRTFEVSARRGIIYDRAGNQLAGSTAVDSVFAVPSQVPDLAGAISLISRITKDDPRETLARCQAAKTFCWISRKPENDVSQRIRDLHLRGIYFQKESKRFYPKQELAAQTLGYVGMDDQGLSGIEREFDGQLAGKPGKMLLSVDARNNTFSSVEQQPEPGQNIVLTIDQQIQYIAERELAQAIADTHAVAGTVIVENPHTGEILALANQPTFNPNQTRAVTPASLKNHAVSDIYEPGSTFKLVTISGALEEKVTNPNEIFDCQMGSILFNGMRIRDSRPHGLLSVTDVLAESSDVGSIKIALRLGEDRFYKYIRDFGFGSQTGIELPGETRGMTKPVSRWSKVSIAAISMGQEIGISPIQLANLISTFANDGVAVPPRIVAATVEPQSAPKMVAFHPAEGHRVISSETAAEMKQMMRKVVLEGTARKAVLLGYSSAGKTGTAQKVDPATGAYSRTKYVASFAGFAPINNPAVVVAVILDSAVGLHQGGQVSAPVFQRITQQVLEYLHVPHDLELPASRQVLMAKQIHDQDLSDGPQDHVGAGIGITEDGASSQQVEASNNAGTSAPASQVGIIPAAMREREPVTATPLAASTTTSQPSVAQPISGTVVLDVQRSGIVVPSFIGKSVRSVAEMAQESGLDLDSVGSGVARDQSPPPGSHVAAGSQVIVRFAR